jgi:ElaB/YqjD/DUF883 family membrane-anchored ribosome-binding protein
MKPVFFAVAVVFLLVLGACGTEENGEQAKSSESQEATSEEASHVLDKMEHKAKESGQSAREKAKEMGEAVQEKSEELGQQVKEKTGWAANYVKEKAEGVAGVLRDKSEKAMPKEE